MLAIKKNRVDNMFQIVKIVVISGFTLPSFGHIKATSLTHYQISFIVYASIPLLTDYCPLTPSLINPFSILQQVRRCHVSKPKQLNKNYRSGVSYALSIFDVTERRDCHCFLTIRPLECFCDVFESFRKLFIV